MPAVRARLPPATSLKQSIYVKTRGKTSCPLSLRRGNRDDRSSSTATAAAARRQSQSPPRLQREFALDDVRYLEGGWEASRYVSVGNVGFAGVEPRALADYLMAEHAIFTAPVNHPKVKGVRITPGMPTLVEHVDRFVVAMKAARRHFS